MVNGENTSDGAKAAVLIVEDEVVSRKALTLLLQLSGYSPKAVGSAEEALRVFGKRPLPELAIVDLDLPGMSGIDLISRLKRLDARIYPVLVTAANESRVMQTLQGVSVAYMQKPVNVSRLLAILHDHVQAH